MEFQVDPSMASDPAIAALVTPGSAPTREVRSSANVVRLSGVHCVPGMDRLRVIR